MSSFIHRTGMLFLVFALLVPGIGTAASQFQPDSPQWIPAQFDDFPVRITVADASALSRLLAAVPLADFDREQIQPMPDGSLVITPRITEQEAADLTAAGYSFTRVRDREQEGRRAVEAFWADQQAKGFPAQDPDKALYYPTHAQIGSDLAALAAANSTIARTFTWGTTVQGRELWGIVISDDVQNTEAEPEVRLSSTIHGDEPVGMVLLWNMAQYLVNNYGQPGFETVTDLVNSTEIHIMPLHNPDGYVADTRTNAHFVDLNRNFPEPAGTHATQEPENIAFMDYAQDHHFVISQNGHGGALVVNYPWDYTYVRAPDDDALIQLSLEYSTYNLPMYNSTSFPQGITNGADWYVVKGTLQDWSYAITDCIDVTVELGNNKWPATSQLDALWDYNRESLLHYIEASHYGIHGVVTDSTSGLPLDATITVTGNSMPVHTDPEHGDYYKLLDTGTFELTFTATGYTGKTIGGVSTTWGTPTTLDVALVSLGPTVIDSLFVSDFESGAPGWTGDWATAAPGFNSALAFTDSPPGDYPAGANTITTMVAGVDLSDTTIIAGELRFEAMWDIEADYDACFLEGSTNGGASWFPVATNHTQGATGTGVQNPSGTPLFDGVQSSWVLNTVDLAPVLGQADLRLRFRMVSDSGVAGAGFAFDDLVIDVTRLDTVSPVPQPDPGLAAISAAPNPFNPTTGIAFTVPRDGPVLVTICDLKGRRVRTLVDETLPAGKHTRRWDGRAEDGAPVASGVYLARMVSGDRRAVTKLTMLK